MSNLSVNYKSVPTMDDAYNIEIKADGLTVERGSETKIKDNSLMLNTLPTTSKFNANIKDIIESENENTTTNDALTANTNESTISPALTSDRPITPIPTKKLFDKRPINLSLNITNILLPTSSTSTSSATTSSDVASAPSVSTASARIYPYENHNSIKQLEIGFNNIVYTVKTGFFKRENKTILNGVNGKFCPAELSAIVGPSGAGKSTLLNLLSSYTAFGYNGDITINGKLRDVKAFKPNVSFITQDATLQPFLTVKEAMHFSANLKIGTEMNKTEKKERVRKILEAIGMFENRHTRSGNLSGGQKKRLAIALELVNDPPVLILDEPTSGLDSSTSNQCIALLKKLANEGRTVICSIHQPSALTFEMFDHMYAIADGKCIYSGGTHNLVSFLAELDLHCPESYNPADYLMEIATDDYGKQNHKLVEKIDNGRNNSYRQDKCARKAQIDAMVKVDKMMAAGLMTPVTAPILSPPNYNQIKSKPAYSFQRQLTPIKEMTSQVWDSKGILNENMKNTKEQQQQQPMHDPSKCCKRENIYATPFYRQLEILLLRTFLILWRDSSLTTLRFAIHFLAALLVGFLYYDIGNDAGNALNNFRYIFYTIMFVMYCAFSSILVKFPLEFPIVSREHFNRWYSLRAYYIAITLADIPIQLICTSLFIFITYVLTGQPMELFRICLFSFMVFLTALVAQSIGLAVGASLSVQLGAILGPFFICPFLTFSGFFLQHKDSPIYMRWLFHISFLKYSLDGSTLAIFGYDRQKLVCNDIYCHYTRPQFFLKDLDMTNANYELAVGFLLLLFLGMRILSFYIMSFRLRLFK